MFNQIGPLGSHEREHNTTEKTESFIQPAGRRPSEARINILQPLLRPYIPAIWSDPVRMQFGQKRNEKSHINPLVRVTQMGYNTYNFQIVPFEEVLGKLDPILKELSPIYQTLTTHAVAKKEPWALRVLEDLTLHPQMDPSDYASIGIEALREASFSPDAIDYFTQVSLPVLVAMHSDHQSKGFGAVVYRFVHRIVTSDTSQTSSFNKIMQETDNAISFVEDRPAILEHVDSAISKWMNAKYSGGITSPIEAVVEYGSFARKDASYLSDVDLLLLSDNDLSRLELSKFVTYMKSQIIALNSLLDVDIWSRKSFPIRNGREQLLESGFCTTLKFYKHKIFVPEERRNEIVQLLDNLNPYAGDEPQKQ